ncbi:hypothetical protein LMH87_011221 [Akanthomyces muscarius]|uniref:Uncharacterized protein n=1 Tax=Akanthomyces muscarius TaxID=2231603 RepID=A0A9W8UJR5_AKAMU|nr:hypothetical protein LMH87_011221 [Akanthomyces muscarius]KAJ4150472.1 hypothetical protein LMH87_011221 [Akanthomyces muscarius]
MRQLDAYLLEYCPFPSNLVAMSCPQKHRHASEKGASSRPGRSISASAAAVEEPSAAAGEQDAQSQPVAGGQVSGSLTEENLRQLSNTEVFRELPANVLSQPVALSEIGVGNESSGRQDENSSVGSSSISWAIDHFWDDRHNAPFGARPLHENASAFYTARAKFIIRDANQSLRRRS